MSSRIYLFSIMLVFVLTFQLSFAQHHSGQQAPPISFGSGQETVKTDIIGATNPKTQTTQDITFETSITIPHEQQFMITSSNILYPIMVKNFQESITNLQYDESSHSIIFQMPFEWNNVEHVDSVKTYFEIPKNFPPFQNVKSFSGTINDVSIFPKDLHYDQYSNKNTNIIHFIIGN